MEIIYQPENTTDTINPHNVVLKLTVDNVPSASGWEEWLRVQLAAITATMLGAPDKQVVLKDLNRIYRESVQSIMLEKGIEMNDDSSINVYYAQFDKKERWYLLWMREFKGGWAVLRQYCNKDVSQLVPGSEFWNSPWGSCTHDGFESEEEAMAELNHVADLRFQHGYVATRIGRVVGADNYYTPAKCSNYKEFLGIMEVLRCQEKEGESVKQ